MNAGLVSSISSLNIVVSFHIKDALCIYQFIYDKKGAQILLNAVNQNKFSTLLP